MRILGPSALLRAGPSALLRAGFDRPVLSIPAVSFESLRTNGWDIEACAEPCRSGLSPSGFFVKLFPSHHTSTGTYRVIAIILAGTKPVCVAAPF